MREGPPNSEALPTFEDRVRSLAKLLADVKTTPTGLQQRNLRRQCAQAGVDLFRSREYLQHGLQGTMELADQARPGAGAEVARLIGTVVVPVTTAYVGHHNRIIQSFRNASR